MLILPVGNQPRLNIVDSVLLAHQCTVLVKKDVVRIADVCYHLRVQDSELEVLHLLRETRTAEYASQLRHGQQVEETQSEAEAGRDAGAEVHGEVADECFGVELGGLVAESGAGEGTDETGEEGEDEEDQMEGSDLSLDGADSG